MQFYDVIDEDMNDRGFWYKGIEKTYCKEEK